MVDTKTKYSNVISSLLQEGDIDDALMKWLSLKPNPPRIPVFYTLTKIHKPTAVGRPIIAGCNGPTESTSAFVEYLLQPIAQIQLLYLKDTTDLSSMDVTSLYTNIPQDEGINTVCMAYKEFHQGNPH